jgi:hypothetical protein
MTEAAKDEAELLERVVARHYTERLIQDGARPGGTWFEMLLEDARCDLAAIRKAGWAVVPVALMDQAVEELELFCEIQFLHREKWPNEQIRYEHVMKLPRAIRAILEAKL